MMMMKRVTLATALLTAVAAGPVLAQNATNPSTTAPGSKPPMAAPAAPAAPGSTAASPAMTGGAVTYVSQQTPNQLLGSKLIGASVVGSEDASIGEINDLLIARNGTVEGVVIGVGGFLGLGEKNVAVPMTALQVTPDGNAANTPKIMVQASKAQLQDAPEFKHADDTDTMSTGSTRPAAPPATAPAAPGAPAAPAR